MSSSSTTLRLPRVDPPGWRAVVLGALISIGLLARGRPPPDRSGAAARLTWRIGLILGLLITYALERLP